LEIPATTTNDIEIHLDQTADIVRHFIHCASSAGSEQSVIDFDVTDYNDHLELCDFLQAPEVYDSVINSIAAALRSSEYCGTPDAWEIFRFAARRDDFALAKLAIGCFDRSKVDMMRKLGYGPPSHFEGVPPRYVFALLRSFMYKNGKLRKETAAAANFKLT
jgi:hypothetical protein